MLHLLTLMLHLLTLMLHLLTLMLHLLHHQQQQPVVANENLVALERAKNPEKVNPEKVNPEKVNPLVAVVNLIRS
jgi:hypothetical protein